LPEKLQAYAEVVMGPNTLTPSSWGPTNNDIKLLHFTSGVAIIRQPKAPKPLLEVGRGRLWILLHVKEKRSIYGWKKQAFKYIIGGPSLPYGPYSLSHSVRASSHAGFGGSEIRTVSATSICTREKGSEA